MAMPRTQVLLYIVRVRVRIRVSKTLTLTQVLLYILDSILYSLVWFDFVIPGSSSFDSFFVVRGCWNQKNRWDREDCDCRHGLWRGSESGGCGSESGGCGAPSLTHSLGHWLGAHCIPHLPRCLPLPPPLRQSCPPACSTRAGVAHVANRGHPTPPWPPSCPLGCRYVPL